MKKHNTAKVKMNQLHNDILGISELQWIRTFSQNIRISSIFPIAENCQPYQVDQKVTQPL